MRLLLLCRLLRSFGDLAALALRLLHGLDDTDSNGLSHVTNSEPTKGRIFVVALNAHRLRRREFDDSGITRFDEFGICFHHLTRSAIDLLDQFAELASNVCSVAIKHWCVAGTDLTRMVEYDDLSVERGSFLSRVIFGIRAHVSTSDVLDGNVLDVEADVVTRVALLELLMVHFDGLDFSGDVGWGEGNDHAGLDDTSFNSADGDCANTTDLVYILQRETEGLVCRPCRGLDTVDSIKESFALNHTTLGLTRPALVPWHAARKGVS
jgi:hypothetical protein